MKKLLLLSILFGASLSAITFAEESTTNTTENSSKTVMTTTTSWSTLTGNKAKRAEKRAKQQAKKVELKTKQQDKREEITQKQVTKVATRAERLRLVIEKINNWFLTSIFTQLDHLFAKAKTEETKTMISEIKTIIENKLWSGFTIWSGTTTSWNVLSWEIWSGISQ